jgi:NAD(P)H-nitrite reductase large subunit
MIVCHCALVSHSELLAAIEGGATSLEELTRRCGASQHCGGCLSAVERILTSPTRSVVGRRGSPVAASAR